ncbi:MAG: transporter substrate-binding domain-containing protein [Proteobacteria bacterium]|nr:transporter substrate-binding domain-containing protein [Pseudomonadota bacterium]
MKYKAKYSIVFVCMFLLFPPSRATAEEVVLLFNDSGYMPFFSGDPGSEYLQYNGHGMLVDFLDAFEAKYPQHSIRRILVPRERANRMITEGTAEGYALNSPLFAGSLSDQFTFSIPIWHTADAVYVNRDQPCYSNGEQLSGKLLGRIRGYGYGPLDDDLKSGRIRSMVVDKHEQLYRVLLANRVDAIVDNIHVLTYKTRKEGANSTAFRACSPALYEFDLSVFVRSEKKAFIRDLNTFIRMSMENGLLRNIERQWLGDFPPVSTYFDGTRKDEDANIQ